VVDFRHGDYRDIAKRVRCVVIHRITERPTADYFAFLRSKLRDGGRLLNHSITRTSTTQATRTSRGFINRYIFPDGELVHVGHLIDRMEHQQLEVRHEENLREHYAMTLRDWVRNLEDHWDEAVEEVGWRKARVWRLYLVASRWGFETNRIQLHQVLATRTPTSTSMPLRPDWN
jgi:cyclopropane-fatty-acyl-phospholipid synthase